MKLDSFFPINEGKNNLCDSLTDVNSQSAFRAYNESN